MTRKRAIKYLMGVAHFDRNTIQKAFADTHKEVPGSSNVQIAAILLENWEDAAIAAHDINFRAAVIVKRFNLEIYHEKELHENPAVRKRPLDDDGKNPFLTYSIDGRGQLFHYKNDEKDENSVLIKIVLIYRGSAYGRNRRKNRGEVYTKRTH